MGYSENNKMVRVDFFKESGKWYTTESVKWTGEWEGRKQLISDAFAQSLIDHFAIGRPDRLSDMDAICIHPYYEFEYPICIKNGGWIKWMVDE